MFFYKVNAFLDRNDLPLNGLATIQGTPLVEKLYPPAINSYIRVPLLHVAPGADAGKIPYYAGKRQFLAILK